MGYCGRVGVSCHAFSGLQATPPLLNMYVNERALRSTLDPVLRGEVTGPDWRAIAALIAASGYLFLSPGEACSNQCNNPDVPNLHASRLQDLCAACRSAPAGVLPGAIDMYLLAGLYRRNSKVYAKVRRASFVFFADCHPWLKSRWLTVCTRAVCRMTSNLADSWQPVVLERCTGRTSGRRMAA